MQVLAREDWFEQAADLLLIYRAYKLYHQTQLLCEGLSSLATQEALELIKPAEVGEEVNWYSYEQRHTARLR